MKKKPLFSGKVTGIKKSGKFGVLSASEIVDKMIVEGFRPNMDFVSPSVKRGIEREYKKRAKQTNKKIKTLEKYLKKTGHHSQSYEDLQESGGRIKEKVKDFEEMQRELYRMENFNESETSTPDGVEQFYDDFARSWDNEFEENADFEMPNLDDKWKYLHRLERYNPAIISSLGGISATLDIIENAMLQGWNMDGFITQMITAFEKDDSESKERFKRFYYEL